MREELTEPAVEPVAIAPAITNEQGPPRVSRPAMLVRVVVGLGLAGVLIGALWAWLAPSVQGVVALTKGGDRVKGYVGSDADHVFLSAAVMVGFLSVLAVVAAAAVWKLRAHRGPAMVGALSIGSMLAAGAAAGVGAVLAHLRYGTFDIAAAPVSADHRVYYVVQAPGVFFGHSPWQIAVTIVFPAGIAALVYAICALASDRDDLGAWPIDPEPTVAFVPAVDPSSPSR